VIVSKIRDIRCSQLQVRRKLVVRSNGFSDGFTADSCAFLNGHLDGDRKEFTTGLNGNLLKVLVPVRNQKIQLSPSAGKQIESKITNSEPIALHEFHPQAHQRRAGSLSLAAVSRSKTCDKTCREHPSAVRWVQFVWNIGRTRLSTIPCLSRAFSLLPRSFSSLFLLLVLSNWRTRIVRSMAAFSDGARENQFSRQRGWSLLGLSGVINGKKNRFAAFLATNAEIPSNVWEARASGDFHKLANT